MSAHHGWSIETNAESRFESARSNPNTPRFREREISSKAFQLNQTDCVSFSIFASPDSAIVTNFEAFCARDNNGVASKESTAYDSKASQIATCLFSLPSQLSLSLWIRNIIKCSFLKYIFSRERKRARVLNTWWEREKKRKESGEEAWETRLWFVLFGLFYILLSYHAFYTTYNLVLYGPFCFASEIVIQYFLYLYSPFENGCLYIYFIDIYEAFDPTISS